MVKFIFVKLKDGNHHIALNTEAITAFYENVLEPGHTTVCLECGREITVLDTFDVFKTKLGYA